MLRALIVAAVSTPAQATQERYSIPAQLEAGRDACQRLDATVAAEVVIPGHSRDYTFLHELVTDCPEYAEIVRLVEAESINVIICWRYDRLWRNDWIRADLMRLCVIHGVQVYSTEQPRPLKSPDELVQREGLGKIVEVFSALASESEQERRVQRHRIGMAGRIARGLAHTGATAPYGYRRDAEGLLIPDPEEAHWVRWMFAQRAAGQSRSVIAGDLTRLGVPTPDATRRPDRAGSIWYARTVDRIVSNPVYRGAVVWGAFSNPDGQHEALVDAETWQRVQILTGAHRSVSHGQTESGRWLLGLLRCGYCLDEGHDRSMTYYCPKPTAGRLYLRCSRYASSRATRCQNNGHSAAVVHGYVTERICAWLTSPEAWQEARAAQAEDGDAERELHQVRKSLADHRQRWERTFYAYQQGIITASDLALHKTTLDQTVRALESREAELSRGLATSAAAESKPSELAVAVAHFPAAPYPERARIARELIRHIVLRRGQEPVISVW